MGNLISLDKKNIADILMLTPVQEGMLFHYLKDSGSRHYFEQLSLSITGPVEMQCFEQAWNLVVETNEMLRTLFRWEKLSSPTQIILKEHRVQLRYYDLSTGSSGEAEKRLEEIKSIDRRETFDLRKVPFRVTLCKIRENTYEVITSHHHILYDGWSNGIILKEFFQAYNDVSNGKERAKSVKTRFKEFIDTIRSRDREKERKFWQEYLEGFDTRTEIPTKTGRSEDTKEIGRYQITISKDIVNTKRCEVSIAALLYSTWGILLQRYGNSEDVVFGTTVSGRSAKVKGIEDVVGLFINTLPLRVQSRGTEKIEHLFQRINKAIHAREEYENTSLVDIKEYSQLGSNEELFDSIVVIENYPLDSRLTQESGKLSLQSYALVEGTHYDLTVGITLFENIEITFIYQKELFARETIQQLAGHFQGIVREMIENPGKELRQVDILSPDEKRRLLVDFNDTHADYPRDKTIHQLFEEQVERVPDHIAVVGSVGTRFIASEIIAISYKDLYEKSNQLAHLLWKKGVRTDMIVGIMVERSPEMVIGILGILKAGAAYLPIDPQYPAERKQYILKDSQARVLLSDGSEVSEVSENIEVIDLVKIIGPIGPILKELPTQPTQLCYVMYTSGSTGKPKGVMVEHGSIVNLLTWFGKKYKLNRDTHVLQMTEYTFDPSVEQIFGTLLHGAVLYLAPGNLWSDGELFYQFVDRNRIHMINFVPRGIKELLCSGERKLKSLQVVICGGERLDESIKNQLIGRGYDVYNHYGPTETAIDAMVEKCSEAPVTLGKPIANVKCCIIDTFLQLAPIGVVGELYISGQGVARGYLNQPELTAEKFNGSYRSYRTYISYKTGDLARWLHDGSIEYLGRMDSQVKIRGFRIEPGEIENRLLEHGDVKEAVVIAKESGEGENYLCAYIVGGDAAELRIYLSQSLPGYMVPDYFIKIAKIPLTSTGKIDRRALPEPEITSRVEYIPPRDERERSMVQIWSEVLGIEKQRIGIDDNFFHLGGHSLKATRLIGLVHKTFDMELPLAQLFKTPTVRGVCDYMTHAAKSFYSAVGPEEKKEYYSLSSAQKRLYVLQRMDESSTAYNIHSAVELEGNLDKSRLENTFRKLIRRHESFRTSFEIIKDEPVQKIHREVEFKLAVINAVENFIKPFDLFRAPLLRVGLLTTSRTKHILMVDMHHIISDGASIGILVKEFMILYSGSRLAPLEIQYKDFIRWHKGEETFWLKLFPGEIPVLDLPTDFPRPVIRSFEGSTVSFEIGKETVARLKKLAFTQGATLYMLLLSLFNVFLAKLSGQEEIVVGTPVAGRDHPDSQHIIGMFVNTLALRNYPAAEKPFRTFLEEVKEGTLKAFENQEYPFEDLVDRLAGSIKRDTGRNPLFDVLFVLQDMDTVELELPGLTLRPYRYENRTSKFDITLNVEAARENLNFSIEYCTKLFNKETAARYIVYIKKLIFSVLDDPNQRIADIDMITEEEIQQLLYDFNDTKSEFPQDKTIHELFEEQVRRAPDRIAIHMVNRTFRTCMTYTRLNEKCAQLAYSLQEKGVSSGDIVGLKVERSVEMVIGILGILKSSAAYLPIDPDYPEERIAYMLKDSGAKVLLTNLPEAPLHHSSFITHHSCNLAYIIYTSGSTGKPKGVMVEHASVVNILWALQGKYPLLGSDTFLLKTSYMFDVSVTELFGWFLAGGRLAVLESGGEKDPGKILSAIETYRVTHINFVPSMFNVFVDSLTPENSRKLSGLRYIFLAGEALLPQLVEKFRRFNTKVKLENIYGPTEATVYAAGYSLSHWNNSGSVPIGRPMSNTALYILDRSGQLQPIGVPGELCISGAGLARGYLNKPELTLDNFINKSFCGVQGRFFQKEPLAAGGSMLLHPIARPMRFSTQHTASQTLIGCTCHVPAGGSIYKTGDLCRWLPDGNIEFLGRMDQQVKVRGFRIELGEIENQLLRHDRLKEAVVIDAGSETGEKHLHACLVPHSSLDVPSVPQLRKYLSQYLPDYMIPAVFTTAEKIPRTSSGKIDRKALLSSSSRLTTGKEYIKPATHIQEQIAELWQQVLGLEKVGIDDNIFDLGGNSFHLVRLNNRLKQELNRDVPMVSLFRHPTIRSLSEFLGQQQEKGNLDRKKRADIFQRSKSDIKQRFQKSKQGRIRLEKSL